MWQRLSIEALSDGTLKPPVRAILFGKSGLLFCSGITVFQAGQLLHYAKNSSSTLETCRPWRHVAASLERRIVKEYPPHNGLKSIDMLSLQDLAVRTAESSMTGNVLHRLTLDLDSVASLRRLLWKFAYAKHSVVLLRPSPSKGWHVVIWTFSRFGNYHGGTRWLDADDKYHRVFDARKKDREVLFDHKRGRTLHERLERGDTCKSEVRGHCASDVECTCVLSGQDSCPVHSYIRSSSKYSDKQSLGPKSELLTGETQGHGRRVTCDCPSRGYPETAESGETYDKEMWSQDPPVSLSFARGQREKLVDSLSARASVDDDGVSSSTPKSDPGK